MSIECQIHKVAKIVNPLATNECQTCEYFNDCLKDMTDEMGEKMASVAGKYIDEIQDTVWEHTKKKVEEGRK